MSTLLAYPGLTIEGWVKTPTTVADKLLSDFFLSDYSQTYAFKGGVSSFSKLIQLHTGELQKLVTETTDRLSTYLRKFFPEVNLEIDYESTDGSDNSYALKIYLEMVDTVGQRLTLGRLLSVENNVITSLMSILREG